MNKKDWLWVVPTIDELLLHDNTTMLEDGEYFHVAWSAKEKNKAKQVPNNAFFAGHMANNTIIAVEQPKKHTPKTGDSTK